MSSTVYRVFIGSTSKDLAEYRAAAEAICKDLQMFPVMMEDFPSMSAGATEGSLKMLADADVYVGIFGFRYGYIEDPTDGRSVTEIEYDESGKRGIDRLCFLADESAKFPYSSLDPDNHKKQQQFRAKVEKQVDSFFDSVPKFQVQLMQALINWRDGKLGITRLSTVIVGTLAHDPADLTLYKPTKLLGRDPLLARIAGWVANGDKILLHGFGGMGKTALAATAAAEFLKGDSSRRVVWARIRSQPAAEIFIGLAHAFGSDAARQVTAAADDHKPRALRALLKTHGVQLIVLDDAWDGPALFATLRSLPDDLPVLVTSRHRYPLEGQIAAVEKLTPSDAVAVLAHYAGRDDLKTDHEAYTLCKTLGHHAFALEIAGKTLKADGIPPDVLEQRIHDAPDQLALPLDYAEPERESVAKLLEASLNELDYQTKAVFLAFGTFFVPSATPELLSRFLDSYYASVATQHDASESVGVDVLPALTTLVRRGLADYIPATDEAVAFYRIHDLAYTYARAQQPIEARHRALQACIEHTWAYRTPSPNNFAALLSEIDQFVAASQWAMEREYFDEVDLLVSNLYAKSQVLGYKGFPHEAVVLLSMAAEAAKQRGYTYNRMAHLNHLGSAYRDLGQVEKSIEYYYLTLQMARENKDSYGEGKSLASLGTAYAHLGQFNQALNCFELSLSIAENSANKRECGSQLGNIANVYLNMGKTQEAIDYYQQALAISRDLDDRRNETGWLGNIGNAYKDSGNIYKAIDCYEQALEISREIGDKRNEGIWLGNLGNAYRDLGRPEEAIGYFQESLTIANEIEDKRMEENCLGNLGLTQMTLGDIQKAISYYEQSLSIALEIVDPLGESNALNNLGIACEKLEQYTLALEYLQQAKTIREKMGAKRLVEKTEKYIADVQAKMRGE